MDGAQPAPAGESLLDDAVIRRVFNQLDCDNNGVLESSDVEEALEELGIPSSPSALREFVTKLDKDHDNKVSYAEFAAFVMLHQEALHRVWATFAAARDGRQPPTVPQFWMALTRLNVHVSQSQAKRLREQILDAQLTNFTEFCSLLMLLPAADSGKLLMQWLDNVGFDTGDEIHLPASHPTHPAWKLLTAGGVAGLVSRTTTAPMDRLKVIMQAATRPGQGGSAGSISGVFRNIYKEGGIGAFWRGNGVNCVKIMPETAIRFWVYENMKILLCSDPDEITVPERFCAGAVAGTVAQVCVYPLEMAKTRLALARTGQYTGIRHCLFDMLRTGGPRSVYRGLSASVTGIIPYSGVDLTVYSLLRDVLAKRFGDEHPGVWLSLCCGAAATTCGQLVAYPLQLVRTRLQAQGMKGRPIVYDGMVDCFRKTVKADGFFGLYRGLLPNFLKALPAISVSYAVYEAVKERL